MKRKINNESRFRQQVLFEGLESGKVSYTDIDFIREIDNEFLIIGDVKAQGNKLPTGQRLLIERLCNKDWRFSIGVIVEHNVPVTEDIYLGECWPTEVYYNKKWRNVPGSKTDEPMLFNKFQDNIKKLLRTKKL